MTRKVQRIPGIPSTLTKGESSLDNGAHFTMLIENIATNAIMNK